MSQKDTTAVLLNPPSTDIAIRDNFCSKISQAFYINHPIDLLFQSGWLASFFNPVLIDAVIEKLTPLECVDKIVSLKPDLVYSLAGNATWPEDTAFFELLRHKLPNATLVCSGDVFLESPVEMLNAHPAIDAVLLDYTRESLRNFATGRGDSFPDLVFRDCDAVITDHRVPPESSGTFDPPIPRHELFLKRGYRYPFVRNRHFATVMTEYGCPFKCSFCVMGTLGCKRRPIDSVVAELVYLKTLGVRDVFFLDQSFGSSQERNHCLCGAIRKTRPDLRWNCFSRVDLVNRDILLEMKHSGCHTIIFGVETAEDTLLKEYRKGYSSEDVIRIFSMAKDIGIRTVATFLLGLPGETPESARQTIEFARQLPCTYASVNVAVPRMGTDMRQEALKKGYVNPDIRHFDQSGTAVVMQTESLSREQLQDLKRLALRRLYLNPRKLAGMFFSIRTRDEALIQIREGFQLFKRLKGKHS
jgi:anaerobic magnesium-protoporphyrin IX monomethyl ester cyclase